MPLTKFEVNTLSLNPFHDIGERWLLISAGNEQHWNTMTASWGGLGVMWGAPSVFCFIRHSRYTKEFVDQNDGFTLTFLKDGYKKQLGLLGSKSGRDFDKMHQSGLTPLFLEWQPTFAEADLTLLCRKRGVQDLPPESILHRETIEKWYPTPDYHVLYIGEILSAYRA